MCCLGRRCCRPWVCLRKDCTWHSVSELVGAAVRSQATLDAPRPFPMQSILRFAPTRTAHCARPRLTRAARRTPLPPRMRSSGAAAGARPAARKDLGAEWGEAAPRSRRGSLRCLSSLSLPSFLSLRFSSPSSGPPAAAPRSAVALRQPRDLCASLRVAEPGPAVAPATLGRPGCGTRCGAGPSLSPVLLRMSSDINSRTAGLGGKSLRGAQH